MPAEEALEVLPMTVDEVSEAASLASDDDAVEVEEVWGVDVAAGEVGPRDEGEDDDAAEDDDAEDDGDAAEEEEEEEEDEAAEDDGEQQDEENRASAQQEQQTAAAKAAKEIRKKNLRETRRGTQRTMKNNKKIRRDIPINIKKSIAAKWVKIKRGVVLVRGRLPYGQFSKLKHWVHEEWNGKFLVTEAKQVENWTLEGAATRKRQRGAGRHSPFASLETVLLAWVKGRRSAHALVSVKDIVDEASVQLANPLLKTMCGGVSVVSSDWVTTKMFRRCHLALRIVKRQSKLTKEDTISVAQRLHSHIHRCVKTGLFYLVFNFDEIPVSLAGSMGKAKCVMEQKDKESRVHINANDFKRCATLVMCTGVLLAADFAFCRHVRVPPYVLLKGCPSQERIVNECYDKRVRVVWTPKGVVNSRFFFDTYVAFLSKELKLDGAHLGLCVMDSCRSHLTPAVQNHFRAHFIHTATIGGGGTSWLQWVDVFFAGAYKGHHYSAWSKVQALPRTSKMKRQLLGFLVAEAVEKTLDGAAVVDQFARLGYINPERCAQIRDIPDYRFVPPVITAEEKKSDCEKISAMAETAKQKASAIPLCNPKPTTKKQAAIERSSQGTPKIDKFCNFTKRKKKV